MPSLFSWFMDSVEGLFFPLFIYLFLGGDGLVEGRVGPDPINEHWVIGKHFVLPLALHRQILLISTEAFGI